MARKVMGSTGSRRRRWLLLCTTVAALAAAAFFISGAAAIVTGSPSSFESLDALNNATPPLPDGNMTNDVANDSDWNCFANGGASDTTGFVKTGITVGTTCSSNLVKSNAVAKPDPAATTSDDSWVNGQKMDGSACEQVTTNKNPAKDDFTAVASYNETLASNKHEYLYGATIRVAPNGNASENVELNQVAGTAACPILRTAGDHLLAFDYLNGGGTLNLHALTWIDAAHPTLGNNNGTCIIKTDSLPCWGATVITPGPNSFEGDVNQSAITAAKNGINGQVLTAGEFAEFGVDLTNALSLNPDACNTASQITWESRSSGSSFSSNPEDISIEKKTVTNCGEIKIIKHTDPRGIDQSFSFTSNLAGTELNCSQTTATSFSLNDKNNTTNDSAGNTQDCTGVPAGTYHVTEGAEPSGFSLEGLSCTASTGSSGAQDGTTPAKANITLAAGGLVTCTYQNKATGEIKIIKHTDPRGIDQSFGYTSDITGNTSFSLNDSGNTNSDNAANTKDVTNVPVGTYHVTEGAEPNGFSLKGLSCTASTGSSGAQDGTTPAKANITLAPGGLVTCTYTNQALGEIKIIKHTDPRGIDQSFGYTSDITGNTSFSLNDSGNTNSDNAANTKDITGVLAGTYHVTEGAEPNGWSLESLSCTASTGSTGAQDGTTPAKANITLVAGGSVTCTYVNHQPLGAILITKDSSKAAATALAGAKFQVCTNNGPYTIVNPCLAPPGVTNPVGPSDVNGHVCVDGLAWNGAGTDYFVSETDPPSGYAIDDTSAHAVTVSANASCPSTGTPATITFKDTPLTTLEVIATSEASGGSKSKISCVDSTLATVGTSITTFVDPADWKTQHLAPDTYTCTVIIDP